MSREEVLSELSSLKPQLICRFPPKDKKGLKIDPGVEASFGDVRF